MNITIKNFSELTLEELYQILKMRVDVFVVEQNCPYPEIDDADQDALHFYIEEDGEIMSYLRVYFKESNKSAIGRIVTKKEARGMGHAPKLILAAIDYLKSKSEVICMQAQEPLKDYYSSYGFVPVSDSYIWDGIPHVDMELHV